MNYTTIEQSKKLLELGIDPKTADAWWYRTTYGEVVDWKHIKWNEEGTTEHLSLFRIEPSSEVAIVKREEIPAWSLNALMELLKVFSKATRAFVATVKLSTAKIMNTADMKEIQRIIKEGHPRQLMVA